MADEDDPVIRALQGIPARKPAQAAAAPPATAPAAPDNDDPVIRELGRIGTRPVVPPMPARFGPDYMNALRARQAAQLPVAAPPPSPRDRWSTLHTLEQSVRHPLQGLQQDWQQIRQIPGQLAQSVTLPFQAAAAGARQQQDPEMLKRMLMWGGDVASMTAGIPELRAGRAAQAAQAAKTAALGPADETAARLGMPREGPTSPVEVATQVAREVPAARIQQQTAVADRFKQAFDQPGEVHAGAFEGYGTRMRGQLGEQGHVIDKGTTPNASKALDYLDENISKFKIENKAGPQMPRGQRGSIVGIKLKGLHQVRLNLDKIRAAAESAASGRNATPAHMRDAEAMQQVVHNFDEHVEKTIADGLFSGDKKALTMLKEARAKESELFKTFDHGTLARAIADGTKGPDEVARALFGLKDIGLDKAATEFWHTASSLLDKETIDKYRLALFTHMRDEAPKTVAGFLDSTVGRSMFNPGERQLILQSVHQPENTLLHELGKIAIEHGVGSILRGYIPGRGLAHAVLRGGMRYFAPRVTQAIGKRFEPPRYGGTGP